MIPVRELRKDKSAVAFRFQGAQPLPDIIKFRRLPSGRAEIANLLQSHDEFEDVFDSNGLPLFSQLNDPFFFCALIALPLWPLERQCYLADNLWRKLRKNVGLLSAQLQALVPLAQSRARSQS
jgi:hypothetical protein